MNCPRCGSDKTKQEKRYEGRGKTRTWTGIINEDCLDCHWHGHHQVSAPEIKENTLCSQSQTLLPLN